MLPQNIPTTLTLSAGCACGHGGARCHMTSPIHSLTLTAGCACGKTHKIRRQNQTCINGTAILLPLNIPTTLLLSAGCACGHGCALLPQTPAPPALRCQGQQHPLVPAHDVTDPTALTHSLCRVRLWSWPYRAATKHPHYTHPLPLVVQLTKSTEKTQTFN